MGKRILLPVAGREHATVACDLAVELFPDGTFVFLHVINPANASFSVDGAVPSFPESWYTQQKEYARSMFADLTERVAEEGIETEQVVELGKPVRTILDTIEAAEIDHVVMGSHGRKGVSRILLGSVAENVVRCSPVPVTVTR